MNEEQPTQAQGYEYNDEERDFGFAYSPPPNNEASLVIQTDPKHILDRIEHILRRDKIDGQGEWKPQKNVAPMLNEEGLNSLMVDAEGLINQNTVMSNLTEKEIKRIVLQLGDTLLTKVMIKSTEWKIDDGDVETIIFTILNMAYIALKRGYMEGERRFLKTSVRSHETIRINPTQQEQNFSQAAPATRRGFWGKFWK